jgi:hypothetical protein
VGIYATVFKEFSMTTPVLDNRIFDIGGWMSHLELSWLFEKATQIKDDGFVVEVGTWLGRSTAALYTGAPESACVVTIDTWKGQPDLIDTDHRLARDANLLDMFLANMALFDITPILFCAPSVALCASRGQYQPPPSPGRYYYTGESVGAAAIFPDKSIDLCFIDGDHNRVAEDIIAFLPKMAPQGILCGHDYSPAFNQITLAVNQLLEDVATVDSIWYSTINRP